MRWNGSRGCPTFRLVLLPPAVEGVEVEHDVAVEVRIGEAQASPGAHLRPEVDVHDLPLGGVHRKRDRRVENGPPRHVGQQVADVVGPTGGRLPRHQRRGHVLGRDGPGGHDPARLPQQHRAGRVHSRPVAPHRPDPLRRRLVTQARQAAHQRMAYQRAHGPGPSLRGWTGHRCARSMHLDGSGVMGARPAASGPAWPGRLTPTRSGHEGSGHGRGSEPLGTRPAT